VKAFEFFGLDENAAKADVQIRYMELKGKFQSERFEIGETGELAAKNLDLLEVYYKELLETFGKAEAKDRYGSEYGEIERVIQSGDLTRAQELLDNIHNRTGEWYYMQSIVYYKQNWFLESKKQLEFAMNMSPDNMKYKDSYDKLTNIIASKQVRPEDLRTTSQPAGGPTVNNGSGSPCTGNCCCDLCVADTCCECMGGDCIPCC
jgi:hypothetical protein